MEKTSEEPEVLTIYRRDLLRFWSASAIVAGGLTGFIFILVSIGAYTKESSTQGLFSFLALATAGYYLGKFDLRDHLKIVARREGLKIYDDRPVEGVRKIIVEYDEITSVFSIPPIAVGVINRGDAKKLLLVGISKHEVGLLRQAIERGKAGEFKEAPTGAKPYGQYDSEATSSEITSVKKDHDMTTEEYPGPAENTEPEIVLHGDEDRIRKVRSGYFAITAIVVLLGAYCAFSLIQGAKGGDLFLGVDLYIQGIVATVIWIMLPLVVQVEYVEIAVVVPDGIIIERKGKRRTYAADSIVAIKTDVPVICSLNRGFRGSVYLIGLSEKDSHKIQDTVLTKMKLKQGSG